MFKRPRRHDGPPPGAVTSASDVRLQICATCHGESVHPIEWCESGPKAWWMRLRCGECQSQREVAVADRVAERYGRHLDRAQRQIARAARELELERMALETEIFKEALERDLIDAGDFARFSR
jgi:hypothetical protein